MDAKTDIETLTATPGKRSTRKAVRVVLATLAIFLLGVALAQALVMRALTPESVQDELSGALHRRVTIGAVSLSTLYGIDVHDVTIFDSGASGIDSRVLFSVTTAHVRPSFSALLQGRLAASLVKLAGARLTARREGARGREEWNVERLLKELTGSGDGEEPDVIFSNLQVRFEAPGHALHGKELVAKRIFRSSRHARGEAVLSEWNGKPLKLSVNFDERARRVDLNFSRVPGDILMLIQRDLRVSGMSGRVSVTERRNGGDTIVAVSGDIEATEIRLPAEAGGRIREMSVSEFTAEYVLSSGEWSAKAGKITADANTFSGKAQGRGRAFEAEIEWKGRIENLLARLPEEVREKTSLYSLRGPASAGGKVKTSAKGRISFSGGIQFEGASLKIPSGTEVGSTRLPFEIAITNLRGSMRHEAGSWELKGMTMTANGGDFRLEGRVPSGNGEWRINLSSPGIDSRWLAPFLPNDVRAAGKVGLEMAIAPSGAEGVVEFRENSLVFGGRSAFHGVRGSAKIARDALVLDNIVGEIAGLLGSHEKGSSGVKASGAVPLTEKGRFDLRLGLERAEMSSLSWFFPDGFSASGPARSIELRITGTKAAPKVAGNAYFEGTTMKPPFLSKELRDIRGSMRFTPDSFVTEGLSFVIGGAGMSISGGVERFDDPIFRRLTVSANEVSLAEMMAILPPEERPLPKGAEVTGIISTERLLLDGPVRRAEWGGLVRLRNGAGILPGLRKGVRDVAGELKFEKGSVSALSLSGIVAGSPAHLEGRMSLSAPYGMDIAFVVKNGDLAELLGAVQTNSTGNQESFDLTGNGLVSARVKYAGDFLSVKGSLHDAGLRSFGMEFDDVNAEFQYESEDEKLTVTGLEGEWARGRADKGTFVLDLSRRVPRFEAAGRVKDAELSRILDFTKVKETYKGLVSGEFEAEGLVGERDSLKGRATVEIRKAQFPQFAPIDGISRALRLDFFTPKSAERAAGSFLLEEGKLKTEDPKHLHVYGENFTLQARGYATLKGDYVFNYDCGVAAGVAGKLLSALPGVEGKGGVIRKSGVIQGKF